MKKIVILLVFISQFVAAQDLCQPYYISPRNDSQHLDLSKNWELNFTDDAINELSKLSEKDWVVVENPTSVQMAWYKAGKLPNPYAHLNAEQYEWMEKKVWYYRKNFNINSISDSKHIFLVFDGLDYFSRIWVNGKLIGKHEGMWSGPAARINDLINEDGNNEVIVEVKSANYNQWDTFDCFKPGRIIKSRTFAGGGSHKPFFALGMWRGARLEMIPEVHIERPFLKTENIEKGNAKLSLSVELLTNTYSLIEKLHPWENKQIANYTNLDLAPKNEIIAKSLSLKVDFWDQNELAFTKQFDVDGLDGRSWIEESFIFENPELWNVNGLGEPNLYKVSISLLKNDQKVDEISFDYGIRTLTQSKSAGPRTGDRWKNWQFEVNGNAFFVKGVNWMPIDPLYNFTQEEYDWVINAAKKEGIQLIRIWGGGLLETEEFYDACNRNGILVWQDFPKNNNLTPEWPQDIWEANVVQNIVRLRNHPSLAVWCGGNEFNPYAIENATTMNIMERSLDDFDPDRMWLRTSPDQGATHLYPDFDPGWFKKRLDLVPFISETGIHCVPEAKGILEVVDPKELVDLNKMDKEEFAASRPEFIQHFMEYNPRRVPRMLSRASHICDMSKIDLEGMAEATQIGAGEFYQVFCDGLQSNYPYTTGVMPWVFKRPWPTVSAINLLDGFGQPSATYYFLKRTYEPIHMAFDMERLLWKAGESFPLNLSLINSERKSGAYYADVEIYNDQFKLMHDERKQISLSNGPSVTKSNFGDFTIPETYKNRFFFVRVSLVDKNENVISHSEYWPRTIPQMEEEVFYNDYLSKPINWPFLDKGPWLKPAVSKNKTKLTASLLDQNKTEEGYTRCVISISNKGKVPSFMTSIDVDGAKRKFIADDNWFWLEPGETKNIELTISWRENTDSQKTISVSSWNSTKNIIKL